VVLAVLATAGALFGGEDDLPSSAVLERDDVEEEETQDDAGGEESSSGPQRCEPFPHSVAEELISNSDTGERKIEGNILETASLKSREMVSGNELWFISINVDGTVVTLGHDVAPGDGIEGSGIYYSMNPESEAATSFPADPRGQVSESAEGYLESIACVQA
jgi:hypothetical protein